MENDYDSKSTSNSCQRAVTIADDFNQLNEHEREPWKVRREKLKAICLFI